LSSEKFQKIKTTDATKAKKYNKLKAMSVIFLLESKIGKNPESFNGSSGSYSLCSI
jgi:hypothetical protein